VIGTAWAQDAAAAAAPSALVQLFPFLLVFLVFYVLVLRPEQRKRQETQRMLGDLKRNDAVVLSGGMHGRVTALADDVITVEISPRVLVQFERSAVQRIVGAGDGDGREKERPRS
jgi:preprotein translocase subunit YajC